MFFVWIETMWKQKGSKQRKKNYSHFSTKIWIFFFVWISILQGSTNKLHSSETLNIFVGILILDYYPLKSGQHGFKKKRSTTTLTLSHNPITNRASPRWWLSCNNGNNIDLLLKRMRILGLPDDLVSLVEVW